MPLFELKELPFCKILQIDAWNAPPHSYFIAYRTSGAFRHAMGLSVIDEFATFSSPIFFAPIPILGKIYNAGISLGHLRDPAMSIDLGWPPLCIGMDTPSPELPSHWEKQLLELVKTEPKISLSGPDLQSVRVGETTVFATALPLLPKQLKRICERATTPFALAFSTGNKLTRQKNAAPLVLQAISEEKLSRLL